MHFGLTPYFVASAVLALMLLAISFIDLDNFYIPDVLSLPGIVLGILFALWTGQPTWQEALLGAVIGAGILALVLVLFQKITGREGMGWGDVKLMGMLGAFCGVWALPAILFIGSLVGIIAAAIWLAGNHRPEEAKEKEEIKKEQENTKKAQEAKKNKKAKESKLVEEDDDFEIPAGAIPFGPFLSIGALSWVFADRLIMELFQRFQELFI
jgi:prepilin signal peptidase PulO-like enzyme (type II secretory pathway)